jgi:membrane protease YdiL (CAAX protease family)
MRVIGWLLVYLAVVFLGAGLIAPALYDLAQWSGRQWPALGGLARNPFHRFVIRAALGLAIVGLWPFSKKFRMFDVREIGLSDGKPRLQPRAAKQIVLGFLVGFVSLATVAALAVVFGNREFNGEHTAGQFVRYLVSAAAAAIIVAVIEEILFRGALYGVLRKGVAPAAALILSSAIYAAVHFIQKAEPTGTVTWLSGVELLPVLFRNLGDITTLIPAFLTLFVAGAILATMYQRTGMLYVSIGLHGGWIFWLKSYRFFTRQIHGQPSAFWGTDNLIDSWLACLVLAALLAGALLSRGGSARGGKNERVALAS